MNILIVSHFFEPFNQVGAVRMNSLKEYLIEKGISVTIIKADNKYYGENINLTDKVTKEKLINVEIKSSHFLIDEFKWKKAYRNCIDKLLSKEKFDWIIFSGGPYFYFDLGKEIYLKYGFKYILDFRDLWVNDSRFQKSLYLKTKILSEYKSIKYAKYVLTVSENDKIIMEKKYNIFKEKFKVIANGFDEKKLAKFNRRDVKSNDDTIKIMIFGKFAGYSPEYTRKFFESVKILMKKEKKIEIIHIGKRESIVFDIMNEFEISNAIYKCMGVCDYLEGMETLQKASILLSIYPVHSGLGTKIYDYIFINKPILLYGYKNSEISREFSDISNFYCCDSGEEGADIIEKVINEKQHYLDNEIDINNYSRKNRWDIFYNELLNI